MHEALNIGQDLVSPLFIGVENDASREVSKTINVDILG